MGLMLCLCMSQVASGALLVHKMSLLCDPVTTTFQSNQDYLGYYVNDGYYWSGLPDDTAYVQYYLHLTIKDKDGNTLVGPTQIDWQEWPRNDQPGLRYSPYGNYFNAYQKTQLRGYHLVEWYLQATVIAYDASHVPITSNYQSRSVKREIYFCFKKTSMMPPYYVFEPANPTQPQGIELPSAPQSMQGVPFDSNAWNGPEDYQTNAEQPDAVLEVFADQDNWVFSNPLNQNWKFNSINKPQIKLHATDYTQDKMWVTSQFISPQDTLSHLEVDFYSNNPYNPPSGNEPQIYRIPEDPDEDWGGGTHDPVFLFPAPEVCPDLPQWAKPDLNLKMQIHIKDDDGNVKQTSEIEFQLHRPSR